MKYAWIKEHRDSFPVTMMCEVLSVSPSGYYDSRDRAPSKRALRHERIKQSVAAVHAESHGIYGSVKIADQLHKCDDLESACRNTVATAMHATPCSLPTNPSPSVVVALIFTSFAFRFKAQATLFFM